LFTFFSWLTDSETERSSLQGCYKVSDIPEVGRREATFSKTSPSVFRTHCHEAGDADVSIMDPSGMSVASTPERVLDDGMTRLTPVGLLLVAIDEDQNELSDNRKAVN
jgi:hypothetical protein